LGRFDNDGKKVGLNGPADGDLSHIHQPEKGKDIIVSNAEKGHGFSFQSGKPMPLPGPGQFYVPPSTGYTLIQAIKNRVDRRLESSEVAPGLHANNTIAVRATVPA
jgi:hypothetical protein